MMVDQMQAPGDLLQINQQMTSSTQSASCIEEDQPAPQSHQTSSSTQSGSTTYTDENGELTWEFIEHAVSMPEKELFIEPHIVAFSAKSGYERPQFVTVSLRNKSETKWLVYRLLQYKPANRDAYDTDSQILTHPYAIIDLFADHTVGLIPPCQFVEFKLIIYTHWRWLNRRNMTTGKTNRLRIQQMCVNDPQGLFGNLEGASLKTRIRQLFRELDLKKEEDALEKIYSREIPVMLPTFADESTKEDEARRKADENSIYSTELSNNSQ